MAKVLDSMMLALLVASVSLNVVMIRRDYLRNAPPPVHPKLGVMLPDLKVSTLEGKGHTIAFGPSQKPKLVYVFSPECGWCDRNLKSINALAAGLGDRYELVAVSVRAKDIRKYASENKLKFQIYHQPAEDTRLAYGFGTTPQTLVLDNTGKLISHWRGAFGAEAVADIRKRYGISVDAVPGLR